MRFLPALALVSLATAAGCTKIPLKPTKALPAGTVVLRFTRKIAGPLDLSIDGTRVPVAQSKKGGRLLRIQGLDAGRHQIFLSSPRDAFGPAQREISLPDDGGFYEVVFAQRFDATLYGKSTEAQAPEGLPKVKAELLAK